VSISEQTRAFAMRLARRAAWAALALGCARAALAAPAVQLVETRPVESTLGNPALPAAHDVWLEMIRGARRSLDFEEFYVSHWPGEPTGDVLDAIGAAAQRGVRVRMLVDARMRRTYPEPADSLGKVPGISVRPIDLGRIAGGIQHAKFFLVDDSEVFLGSQNFDWRALKHIHELGVRVRDPGTTAVFGAAFDMDWEAAGDQLAGRDSAGGRARAAAAGAARFEGPARLAQGARDTVELWPSYSPRSFVPDTALWDRDAVVRMLDSARREIVVQLLTYAVGERGRRDDAIDAALRRAAARGVAVKLVVSDWEADGPRIADLQSLSQVPNVEARLSTVPEWSGGYIPFARVEHCKYAVVDSTWTWVGTSNWEPGYFHASRNIAVTMKNRNLALEARRIFEASWTAAAGRPVRAGETYAPKTHGMTPPPGKSAYGR
jgi:phosphatidylserine/phosphatidylglycerophosphate/cardiolipin synthase-like enzyme